MRIGNGKKMWNQPWLKSKDNYFVTSHPPLGLEDMKVHSIINHDTRSWRMDIMTQIFNTTTDLGNIQNMHLIDTDIENDRIWKHTPNGISLLENMLSTSVIYDFQHRFLNRC